MNENNIFEEDKLTRNYKSLGSELFTCFVLCLVLMYGFDFSLKKIGLDAYVIYTYFCVILFSILLYYFAYRHNIRVAIPEIHKYIENTALIDAIITKKDEEVDADGNTSDRIFIYSFKLNDKVINIRKRSVQEKIYNKYQEKDPIIVRYLQPEARRCMLEDEYKEFINTELSQYHIDSSFHKSGHNNSYFERFGVSLSYLSIFILSSTLIIASINRTINSTRVNIIGIVLNSLAGFLLTPELIGVERIRKLETLMESILSPIISSVFDIEKYFSDYFRYFGYVLLIITIFCIIPIFAISLSPIETISSFTPYAFLIFIGGPMIFMMIFILIRESLSLFLYELSKGDRLASLFVVTNVASCKNHKAAISYD